MRAILCKEWGPPEKLVMEELPVPVPAPGEVRIAVTATSLNFADTLIIERKYQLRPPLPFSPGAEVAGVIAELGPDVSGFAVGERVITYLAFGGAREQVIAPAGTLIKLPDTLKDEAAAGLLVAYGTTLHALRQRGRLKAGESLVILGASGGVGQAAIEIGKLMGARVIAVASPDKLDFCRQMGADHAISYEGETSLKERLKAITGGGVDVVYDAVGGPHSEEAVRALSWGGRLLVVGFAAGEIPRIPLNLLLLKGCDLIGIYWGRFLDEEPELAAQNHADIVAWAASGAITPRIHAILPLERTAEAITLLKDRSVRGKVIVKM